METEQEWERTVRRKIETDLFYFIQCPHCQTVFFIEESIDRGHHHGGDSPSFRVTCPRCQTAIHQASIKRLKLSLDKVMGEDEINQHLAKLAEKLEL